MCKQLVAVLFVSAVAYGQQPPSPPGPEGWTFRKELAEDPPPAYDVPKGTPWLENRISRCFFSPIKRAPFYRDELKDDIDYYPDNYLERLRREGVNGLWLTVVLGDLDDLPELRPRDGRPSRDPLREMLAARAVGAVCGCCEGDGARHAHGESERPAHHLVLPAGAAADARIVGLRVCAARARGRGVPVQLRVRRSA